MRPLERYWLKVALAVGALTIALLMLMMTGMAQQISHLFRSITEAAVNAAGQ